MGEFTSTNEETLVRCIDRLGKHESLILCPRDNWVDVYVVPDSVSFSYLSKDERKPYLKCSFSAVSLHKPVWQGNLARAVQYR